MKTIKSGNVVYHLVDLTKATNCELQVAGKFAGIDETNESYLVYDPLSKTGAKRLIKLLRRFGYNSLWIDPMRRLREVGGLIPFQLALPEQEVAFSDDAIVRFVQVGQKVVEATFVKHGPDVYAAYATGRPTITITDGLASVQAGGCPVHAANDALAFRAAVQKFWM